MKIFSSLAPTRRLLAALLTCVSLAAALAVSTAQAGTGALHGRPSDGSKEGCFSDYFGGVINTCATRERWTMTAVVNSASTPTFNVHARGVSGTASTVSCAVGGINWDASAITWSSTVSTIRHDGATETLSVSTYTPGDGATFIFCDMDPQTLVRSYTN